MVNCIIGLKNALNSLGVWKKKERRYKYAFVHHNSCLYLIIETFWMVCTMCIIWFIKQMKGVPLVRNEKLGIKLMMRVKLLL